VAQRVPMERKANQVQQGHKVHKERLEHRQQLQGY
jgi:hypothetical protein